MFAGLAVMCFAAVQVEAAATPSPIGIWKNPKGTVTVRTAACGRAICGRVIAATPEAQEKARRGGTARLVGTEIMSDFMPAGRGRWQGMAFIPDLGITADGVMTQTGPNTIEIEGCGLGGYFCKSQVWTRLPEPRARKRR